VTDSHPRRIRSLAVTLSDVVAAYEARERSPRRTVLRVTPPFSGRMRARIHTAGPAASVSGSGAHESDLDPETGALHLPPARFVAADAVGPYPNPDDTEDALRADPDAEFSVERHRERHVEAVEAWRERVRSAIVDSLEIRLPDGSHEVAVKTLDDSADDL
jgi:hypothetical protein